ncbi:AAA family ATPase [Deinococcus sp. QL22]|uniref:AAA family ATPase n=1 Tax=Deinococcus sp. QL22 TaxID=2939437 RepID=UPI002016C5C3|nr:AAA family ATPase [Deinococcus sp. QL22]UQN04980.1 AAA family ATPase [Deinococcus sp. QL22]
MTAPREPRALRVFNGQTAPPVKAVEWLVERFLARGAGTLLFGQPGVSKSAHTAHLVACLVAGQPFAHLKTSRRGLRVLYLDFDGSWEWNHELFEAAFRGVGIEGIPEAFVYYSPNTEECNAPEEGEGLKALEAMGPDIAQTVKDLNIDLVICDSLGQMMIGDTNNGQEVALALRLGLNPARKAGAAVLVIDHATKSAAGGVGIPTPMGSQQKRAWARVSVALEGEELDGKTVTRWSVDKSNTAPFEPFHTRLNFTNTGERLEVLDLDFLGEAGPRIVHRERDERAQEAQREILDALQDGPLVRAKLGGKGGTFDRALKTLETAGQVVKLERGLYGLPEHAPDVSPPHQPLGSGVVKRSESSPATFSPPHQTPTSGVVVKEDVMILVELAEPVAIEEEVLTW